MIGFLFIFVARLVDRQFRLDPCCDRRMYGQSAKIVTKARPCRSAQSGLGFSKMGQQRPFLGVISNRARQRQQRMLAMLRPEGLSRPAEIEGICRLRLTLMVCKSLHVPSPTLLQRLPTKYSTKAGIARQPQIRDLRRSFHHKTNFAPDQPYPDRQRQIPIAPAAPMS
ncbi:MAG: hypothetical protein ACLPV8_16935 [Steroidobacteraceae bacterium]